MKKIILLLITILLLAAVVVHAEEAPENFNNPILSGYHPDPSICRVGDDYYLVNSTFVWYPGIPIYHSKDLVNWQLIGHGIHRPDQLDFNGLIDKFGVFAVTIRHHEGTFYLITTAVQCGGNFYMTAEDPAGPWSDPIWLENAPGIDPSLMWDDDGKCYYTGHMNMGSNSRYVGHCGIWNQELDLDQQKLVGKRDTLTFGHSNNASYTEGPHLYKINGNYLLMVSEGGTGTFHALTVHHSDSLISGPYVTDHINPVLTHRHFGWDYPIQAIGHGDLVQTQKGDWWAVTLGKRNLNGYTTLARETFLVPFKFSGKTPIFNYPHGRVLEEQKRPDLPWTPVQADPAKDEFGGNELALKWCTIRTPKETFYSVKNGNLKLKVRPQVIDSLVNSSLLIQRIEHYKFSASTKLTFKTSKNNEQAGLCIYRASLNHYQLMKGKNELVLVKTFKGKREAIARVKYNKSTVFLKAEGNDLDVTFSYGESWDKMKQIGITQSLTVIADGNGNQFNGPGVGMYATSNGKKSKVNAVFDWFEYVGE